MTIENKDHSGMWHSKVSHQPNILRSVIAPTSSDADLIAAHVAGDPDAFAELVRRHRDRLWAVALRTLRDPEEAADAVQEALISAFRAAGRFRAESQVGTWLHRIVINACLDRIRRRQVRPTVPLPETEAGAPVAPGDAMADLQTRMVIQDALATLPAEQRVPIVLVDVEGYTVAETANMLGIAEGTVKSRCARGRVKLAKLLGHLRNPDSKADVSVKDMPVTDVTRRQHRTSSVEDRRTNDR